VLTAGFLLILTIAWCTTNLDSSVIVFILVYDPFCFSLLLISSFNLPYYLFCLVEDPGSCCSASITFRRFDESLDRTSDVS